MTLFLKWHIDMVMQSQILTIYVHKSIIIQATTHLSKETPIHKLSHSQTLKTQHVEHFKHPRYTTDFIVAT